MAPACCRSFVLLTYYHTDKFVYTHSSSLKMWMSHMTVEEETGENCDSIQSMQNYKSASRWQKMKLQV